MKTSLIQMNSGSDIERNLNVAEKLISACCESDHPELVALPEFFSFLSGNPLEMREAGEVLTRMDIPAYLSRIAARNSVAIHAGSSLIVEGEKLFNQSITVNSEGDVIASYRKIHLFDIVLPDGKTMFESDFISRGTCLSSFELGGFNFGASICFDVRYPELYARLIERGANALLVPAAFTYATGSAHWEILLRARAIETQSYVLAPAQVFSFSDGKYANWGHSMIIDPWGSVVAQMSEAEGFVTANLSLDLVQQVRSKIPVPHNRYWSISDE